MEFHRQIVEGFGTLMADVREQTAERFERLRLVDAAIDLSAVGPAGSSSTWTYLVSDNPFSTSDCDARKPQTSARPRAMGMLASAMLASHDDRGRIGVRQAMARETALDQDCGPLPTHGRLGPIARLRRCSTA